MNCGLQNEFQFQDKLNTSSNSSLNQRRKLNYLPVHYVTVLSSIASCYIVIQELLSTSSEQKGIRASETVITAYQ